MSTPKQGELFPLDGDRSPEAESLRAAFRAAGREQRLATSPKLGERIYDAGTESWYEWTHGGWADVTKFTAAAPPLRGGDTHEPT